VKAKKPERLPHREGRPGSLAEGWECCPACVLEEQEEREAWAAQHLYFEYRANMLRGAAAKRAARASGR
jgi:hypothetical protein